MRAGPTERFECKGCGRLLFKYSKGALRPDGIIEDKCYACNRYNTLVGDAQPGAPVQPTTAGETAV